MGVALLVAAALLGACSKKVPFERGLTSEQRANLSSVRLLTVVPQDELGAQYRTRTTTARLLNTAQIHGVAFSIKGALYIGPAPDSMTPWLDTRDYVPEDVGDVPGVVMALDPGNAVRVATKIVMAPVLRVTEKGEHQESGEAAYKRIEAARAVMRKLPVTVMFRDDQTRELKSQVGVKFASRNISREWPATILARGVQPKEKPLLLLFTQYTLTSDLRQLHVQTEATAMRPGDTIEAPTYRNRFVYESPRLPVPGKPVEAGAEPEGWDKDELAKLMLGRWLKDDASLLKQELARASSITARDLAMDIAGRLYEAQKSAKKAEKKP